MSTFYEKGESMMTLGIYGAGGQGREVLDSARAVNRLSKQWENIVFIDDVTKQKNVNDAKVYPFEEFSRTFRSDTAELIIAVGEPVGRKKLYEKITSAGYALAILVHPTAIVSDYADIGKGAFIGAHSMISCNTLLAENVCIQPHAVIGHDTTVGTHSVLSGFTIISGHCAIGEQSYIGIGAAVREEVSIGSNTIIGMGSSVICDVPDGVVAFGTPCRVQRNNTERRVFQ